MTTSCHPVILSEAKDLYESFTATSEPAENPSRLQGTVAMTYYTYILTNWNNKVMYIGMTNNLERRLYEHRRHVADGFTSKYNVNKLVYYESTTDVKAAIAREKQLKGWLRARKNALVEGMNPTWRDLSEDWDS